MPVPSKADRWLPRRTAAVLAAVEAAGPEPIRKSRLGVAVGLAGRELDEVVRQLVYARLLAETTAPPRYTLTAEGRAKIAVWHALRGDGRNRPAEGHDVPTEGQP